MKVQIQELQDGVKFPNDAGDLLKDLETASSSGPLHVSLPSCSCSDFFLGKLRRDSYPQLNTRDLCSMEGNVFVVPSAPDDPTAPPLRSVYARSPTATTGEPMLSSTGKSAARFDETNMETQSFTIPNPRFAGNVPTVNPRSSAEDVDPQNFMVVQPKTHLSDLEFGKSLRLRPSIGRRVSKQ